MTRFFIAGVLGVLASCQGTNPATCEAPNRTVDGVCRRGCRNATDCLLGEACVAGTCRATLLPVAVELTATPSPVPRGADVQLNYLTARATRVQLESRTDLGAVESLLDTVEPSGTHRLVGVQEPLIIVLRAENSEGTDELETPIAIVGDGPRIWAFEATPSTVGEGDPVTLSWSVTGATNIEIRESASGPPTVESTELMGMVSVTPLQTTTYQLTATNGAETAMESVSVTVQTVGSPTVLGAQIDAPELAVPKDGAVLSWQTENATAVVIRSERSAPIRVVDPDQVKDGAALIEVLDTSLTWEVVAERGTEMSPAFAVPLAPVPGIELESLIIDPDTLRSFPSTANVDIEWGLVGDVASVALSGGGTSASYSGPNIPNRLRTSVATNRPTTFLFTATGPRGFTVEHQATAWPTTEESANDTRATAQRIDGAAVVEAELGRLTVLEDWYVLSVAANQTLRVRFDGSSRCPSSVALQIYDEASNVPKETFPAPTGDRIRAVYVPDLPAGDAFVQVTAPAADIGAIPCEYTLYAEPFSAVCGNGMVDAGEECDDGNTLPRDGCDPTCTPPPLHQYTVRGDQPATALGPRAERVKLWRRGDGSLPPEDDGLGIIELPFDFPFYGRRHRAVLVQTRGLVVLSGAPNAERYNTVTLFNTGLQFDPNDAEAGIFTEVRNGPTGQEVAISFRRMQRDGPSGPVGPPTSGAIILSESGRIELTYPEAVPSEFGRVYVGIQSNTPGERALGHPHPTCSGVVCPDASVLTDTRAGYTPVD